MDLIGMIGLLGNYEWYLPNEHLYERLNGVCEPVVRIVKGVDQHHMGYLLLLIQV